MIGALVWVAASVAASQYSFCGVSADSADDMARTILKAADLEEEIGTAQWRVRSNGLDMICSIGLPDKGGPHAVVCRHITPNANGPGSVVDMEVACDGTDAVCDKVRDDFVDLNRRALPR